MSWGKVHPYRTTKKAIRFLYKQSYFYFQKHKWTVCMGLGFCCPWLFSWEGIRFPILGNGLSGNRHTSTAMLLMLFIISDKAWIDIEGSSWLLDLSPEVCVSTVSVLTSITNIWAIPGNFISSFKIFWLWLAFTFNFFLNNEACRSIWRLVLSKSTLP